MYKRQPHLQTAARRPNTSASTTSLESTCVAASLAGIAGLALEPCDEGLDGELLGQSTRLFATSTGRRSRRGRSDGSRRLDGRRRSHWGRRLDGSRRRRRRRCNLCNNTRARARSRRLGRCRGLRTRRTATRRNRTTGRLVRRRIEPVVVLGDEDVLIALLVRSRDRNGGAACTRSGTCDFELHAPDVELRAAEGLGRV
jgi:hypothetical protein